ncbi:MAG: mannose-1-phosphate guanylyltransferase/mannose-6-phosphate isomerase [Spirochaetia bacterium]|nr:mannose-1-phosphate guanylyltransferase/mannose-6-phosphate isomerase [Spirochaetia bacterium]
MINIILSGGSGTRLWPVSRKMLPKQFVKIFNGQSLFQKTLLRNRSVCDEIIILGNDEQFFLAKDQIEEVSRVDVQNQFQYILEPFGRNTAPAIALGCMAVKEDSVVLVTPSDHLVKDETSYKKVMKKAEELALAGYLVVFGINPSSPETGFGYIHVDGETVLGFKEKPDLATAETYVASKKYLWNSGMFCFKASVYLNELKKQAPDIYEASLIAFEEAKTKNPIRINDALMMKIPDNSIDYAVLEKSDKMKVVAADIGWSDMGSFESLKTELPTDQNGNTVCENFLQINSKNNFVLSSGRTIAAIDIEDLTIVDTPDALLIARQGSGQKVKNVVQMLKDSGSDLHDTHLTSHRPWGTYTVLEESDKYKIKRIVVKPGKRLSLQKHFHRSEHWVVVSGTAVIKVGESEETVQVNQSVYIPIGKPHRLQNPGRVDLVLIEVQVGEYLGEDDIVRLQDDFNRQT